MLKAGFITPLTIFISNSFDRNDLYNLFQNLNQFILSKNITDGGLIYDRLYKRYVRFEDIDKTNLLMRTIEKDFLDLNKSDNFQYKKFFHVFYQCIDEIDYLRQINHIYGRFQIGLLDLPYIQEEKLLPNEYFDNLSSESLPVWMRAV